MHISLPVRKLLIVWSAFSLIVTLGVIIFVANIFFFNGAAPKINEASLKDVKFVLNQSGLGNHQVKKVLNSIEPSHLVVADEAYAFRVSKIDIAEFTNADSKYSKNWYRGDQLPLLLKNVVERADGHRGNQNYDLTWFPEQSEVITANFYLYPIEISLSDSLTSPRHFTIVLARPADNMVFYLKYRFGD